jgi:hypothetical protein
MMGNGSEFALMTLLLPLYLADLHKSEGLATEMGRRYTMDIAFFPQDAMIFLFFQRVRRLRYKWEL